MNRPAVVLLLTALILGNCTLAPASPTPPAPATATQTVSPSKTPLPTRTAVSIATPYPPLQTDGPYLLFIKERKTLTLMGVDGIIHKEIQLPNRGYSDLEKAVSPNGRWLAYFTGRIQEPYDFTLNTLDISDGESNIIANLIAPGYPENLRPIAETLELSHYQAECSNVECLIRLNSAVFDHGISSIAWSPDGQFLAFAAQIDGPSSDIYLYDTESRTIRRLTDEFEHIWSIKWSPTGVYILYDAALPGPVDPYDYWYVADTRINTPQSSRMNAGPSPFVTRFGWITDTSYLYAIDTVYYEPMGPGPIFTSVQYINLENNEKKEIWPYGSESIVLDQENSRVILTTMGENDSQLSAGTYMVSLEGSFVQLSDTTHRLIVGQDSFKTYFGQDENDQIYSISPNGEVKLFGQGGGVEPIISPNKKWILLWESRNKLNLYSDDLQLVNSWNFELDLFTFYQVKWHPESLGILISSDAKHDYISIPDGKPVPIDIPERFVTWLP